MTEIETPKRLGRPPIEDEDAKRYPLSVRTTVGLRKRLEEAATASGKSLAQEVESRLEWSMVCDDELGGAQAVMFYKSVAAAIRQIEARTGKSWLNDFTTWRAATRVMQSVALNFCPPPPNIAASYKALLAYNEATDRYIGMAREAYARWPMGPVPNDSVNALLAASGTQSPFYAPDGSRRSDEEIAMMNVEMSLVRDAQKEVDLRKEELDLAEADEKTAEAMGDRLADEVIATLRRNRGKI